MLEIFPVDALLCLCVGCGDEGDSSKEGEIKREETCNLDPSCNVLANGRASVSPFNEQKNDSFPLTKQSFFFFFFLLLDFKNEKIGKKKAGSHEAAIDICRHFAPRRFNFQLYSLVFQLW